MKISTVLAFVVGLFPQLLFAGPQYIDETGYAASGYDVVAYFDMQQSPVRKKLVPGVLGKSSFVAEYNGAKWAFSSERNLKKFTENPAGFAPQYNGHCAYGVAQGGKVPGNPNLWRVVDGKLYLNVTEDVVGFWEENISGNLKKSERNWKKLEPAKASKRTIPFFSSLAPIAN
jgi:YHS domain-containing protein